MNRRHNEVASLEQEVEEFGKSRGSVDAQRRTAKNDYDAKDQELRKLQVRLVS
jgi:hypothetical protein